jgi:predicted phosphodiesterase
MRYGVIADIHGNALALTAAVEALERERVDRYLCLGDLVGFGPHPNACVRRVAELGGVSVAGNHDLIAVGRRSAAGCSRLARESLAWTRPRLDRASRSFLEELPELAVPEPGVVMTHGAVGDPGRYVAGLPQAAEELGRLRSTHPQATLLVLGHTHVPMAVGERTGSLLPRRAARAIRLPAGERVLLNPGAVGQSRRLLPHGSALVLDTDAREARLLVVRYDVAGYRRALVAAGLPAHSHHRRPYAPRALAGRARRLARVARRRL